LLSLKVFLVSFYLALIKLWLLVGSMERKVLILRRLWLLPISIYFFKLLILFLIIGVEVIVNFLKLLAFFGLNVVLLPIGRTDVSLVISVGGLDRLVLDELSQLKSTPVNLPRIVEQLVG
jgi:hypothetical protein